MLRAPLQVVAALAYAVLVAWFAWSILDEDSQPDWFVGASIVAAVIVLVDFALRLRRDRRG
jgi:hypothetical protein